MIASETCDTGREGNGFTSTSDPSSFSAVCQPGKVAKRTKQTKAKMIAMILIKLACVIRWQCAECLNKYLHQIWEHNHILKLTR